MGWRVHYKQLINYSSEWFWCMVKKETSRIGGVKSKNKWRTNDKEKKDHIMKMKTTLCLKGKTILIHTDIYIKNVESYVNISSMDTQVSYFHLLNFELPISRGSF